MVPSFRVTVSTFGSNSSNTSNSSNIINIINIIVINIKTVYLLFHVSFGDDDDDDDVGTDVVVGTDGVTCVCNHMFVSNGTK